MNAQLPRPPGLASVIIPCFNQLEHTRPCIAALSRQTRMPWELIVVDNGSTDGTAEYLHALQDIAGFRIEVVSNAENRGFPAACNQGLAVARGDYLVLLNNDTVVTNSWLEQLVALADSDPKIGMVGPMTNYASPPQLVPEVPYGDLVAMEQFACSWRLENRGRWFKVPKLSGFCVLMKRAAFEAVGGLDERFGLGFFDDDDLSLRMQRAGFDLAVALDLFIHHSGSRTFVGSGIDTAALLETNLGQFREKWKLPELTTRPVALTSWAVSNGSGPPRVGHGVLSQGVIGFAEAPAHSPQISARLRVERADLPAGFVIPRLTAGNSREMVTQAVAIVAAFAGPAAQKARLWERLADQIIDHGRRHGSSWGMARLSGSDGSIIYLGRASEFLVLDSAGTLFRGKGTGCLAGSERGVLIPFYPRLSPVSSPTGLAIPIPFALPGATRSI